MGLELSKRHTCPAYFSISSCLNILPGSVFARVFTSNEVSLIFNPIVFPHSFLPSRSCANFLDMSLSLIYKSVRLLKVRNVLEIFLISLQDSVDHHIIWSSYYTSLR